MANIISPNMNLIIPTVGTEPGPTYAFDVNASLTLIDQHDHTPGKGVPITSGSLAIDADLPFNGFSATHLATVGFDAQSTATSNIQSLSVAPGGESPTQFQDLFYTDSNGTKIQITKDGALIPSTADVEGINYIPGGTFQFTQAQPPDNHPLRPANIDSGSITLRPNIDSTVLGVTLDAAGINSTYTLALPANPGGLGGSSNLSLASLASPPADPFFITINNLGQILQTVDTLHGITGEAPTPGGNIALSTITSANIRNQQLDTPTVTHNGNSSSGQASPAFVEYDTSGGTYTFSLYQPVSTSIGQKITVKKISSDINILTIDTFGGTIDGALTTTLSAQNECVVFQNDGNNWFIVSRTPTIWVNSGAITFESTGTNPTKGTISTDNFYYRRVGNTMVCRVQYQQTTSGTDGTGTYLIRVPAGFTIDTTLVSADNSTGTPSSVKNSVGTVSIQVPGGGMFAANVIVFDNMHVSIQGFEFALTSAQYWSSTVDAFSATSLSCNGVFELPIVGWN